MKKAVHLILILSIAYLAAPVQAQDAKQKGLDFKYSIENEVPDKLIGDPDRLRQVLLNLLSNALKFTEQGKIELKTTLKAIKSDKAILQFSVHDTGIGISEDQHERIFESFTQVDGSNTRKFGGTGLGLAISQRLVWQMGGRIWVTSNEHKGSVFGFTSEFGLEPVGCSDSQPAPPTTGSAIKIQELDESSLLARLDGDIDLARELLGLFEEQCPNLINRIQEAMTSQDLNGLRMLAHNLKGAAASIEALAVRNAAANLETRAIQEDLPAIAETFATLQAEAERTLAKIKIFLGS